MKRADLTQLNGPSVTQTGDVGQERAPLPRDQSGPVNPDHDGAAVHVTQNDADM